MVIEKNVTDQEQELRLAESQLAATLAYVQSMGVKLPDTLLDMSDWLTIKRYAEKHDLSQQVVVNWIGRGTIPAECIRVVPELNDMRLIRDRVYK